MCIYCAGLSSFLRRRAMIQVLLRRRCAFNNTACLSRTQLFLPKASRRADYLHAISGSTRRDSFRLRERRDAWGDLVPPNAALPTSSEEELEKARIPIPGLPSRCCFSALLPFDLHVAIASIHTTVDMARTKQRARMRYTRSISIFPSDIFVCMERRMICG